MCAKFEKVQNYFEILGAYKFLLSTNRICGLREELSFSHQTWRLTVARFIVKKQARS